MNESEHINFFARHEFYIFSECKFSRDVNVNLVEVWFKFISSSLRTTLTLISWCQTTANKYGLFYFYLFNFTFGRWSVVLTLSFASSPAQLKFGLCVWTIGYNLFQTILNDFALPANWGDRSHAWWPSRPGPGNNSSSTLNEKRSWFMSWKLKTWSKHL